MAGNRARSHFLTFQPHTRLKHGIFREYFQRWGRILLFHPGARTRLRVVDACAGRGRDDAGLPGSPLIAITEAREAAEQLSRMREEDVEIEVVAIEKRTGSFHALKRAVSELDLPHRAAVHLVHGTLGDVMSSVEKDFATVPTFFFIDPFGMDGIPADLIRRAMAGERNEVLLLFAGQAALRHVGAFQAGEPPESKSLQGSLFDVAPVPEPRGPSETEAQRRAGAKRSAQILDAAFGGFDWRGVVETTARGYERREALLALYCGMLRDAGAPYVLTIPIMDPGAHLKYHLVHASRSPKAVEVMKEAAHAAWGKSEVGDRAVFFMQYGTGVRAIMDAAKHVAETYAGRKVRWSKGQDGELSLRQFVLQQTDLWPHHFEELRRRLKPYEVTKGHYNFPA